MFQHSQDASSEGPAYGVWAMWLNDITENGHCEAEAVNRHAAGMSNSTERTARRRHFVSVQCCQRPLTGSWLSFLLAKGSGNCAIKVC